MREFREIKEKWGNLANIGDNQGDIRESVCLCCSINRFPNMLEMRKRTDYAHNELIGFHFL